MAAVGRLAASLAPKCNPLQAIQNSLHLALHQGLEEEKRRQFLEMAQQEVARLVQIVRRMLDFYRPSSAMQPLDVNRPVEDALAIAGKRLQQARIEVVSRLSSNLPPTRGAPNQLTQVFLNIIINAVEAMPDGGTCGWAVPIAERRQIGSIPRQRHLASRRKCATYVRTLSPRSRPARDWGWRSVTAHYRAAWGMIEVESPPGAGTTFIVRLPQHYEEERLDGRYSHSGGR